MSQLLAGAGSAFSSLGSQVAAQASVPHQDLGLVVSLLLLWSSIGASVGEYNRGSSLVLGRLLAFAEFDADSPSPFRAPLSFSLAGDAIAGQYWGSRMPSNLRQYLPASINDTEVESFYADITTIKEYDFGSAVREGATRAYE